MIIDSHVHLGEDYVFDEVNTEDELTKPELFTAMKSDENLADST